MAASKTKASVASGLMLLMLIIGTYSPTAFAQSWSEDCAKLSGDKAISACDMAIRLNPKNTAAFFNRGLAWYAKNHNDRAIADYNEVIRLYPQHVSAFYHRGLARRWKGQCGKAIADFNEVLRLSPSHVSALHERGVCRLALNDDDGAMADFNEAERLLPGGDALYTRAILYERKNDLVQALNDLKNIVRIDPTHIFGLEALKRVERKIDARLKK
jgi:tetratricopeptide (TPR) repeat protein